MELQAQGWRGLTKYSSPGEARQAAGSGRRQCLTQVGERLLRSRLLVLCRSWDGAQLLHVWDWRGAGGRLGLLVTRTRSGPLQKRRRVWKTQHRRGVPREPAGDEEKTSEKATSGSSVSRVSLDRQAADQAPGAGQGCGTVAKRRVEH